MKQQMNIVLSLFLQVTMLGFSETLKWEKALYKGLMITLPYVPPSALPVPCCWTLKLEGVA